MGYMVISRTGYPQQCLSYDSVTVYNLLQCTRNLGYTMAMDHLDHDPMGHLETWPRWQDAAAQSLLKEEVQLIRPPLVYQPETLVTTDGKGQHGSTWVIELGAASAGLVLFIRGSTTEGDVLGCALFWERPSCGWLTLIQSGRTVDILGMLGPTRNFQQGDIPAFWA